MAFTVPPFAYWPATDISGQEIVSQGNHIITLTQNNADDVTTANPGWLTLTGAQHFDVDISTLSSTIQNFLSPKEGFLLIWAECVFDTSDSYALVTNNTMTLAHIGDNSIFYQSRISQIASLGGTGDDRYQSTINDGTTQFDNYANRLDDNSVCVLVNQPRTVALLVDNRDPEKQTRLMRALYFADGTVDIEGCLSIDLTAGRLRFGNNFDANNPVVCQIKNMGIMNVGPTLPIGIDAYMQALFFNGGDPTTLTGDFAP